MLYVMGMQVLLRILLLYELLVLPPQSEVVASQEVNDVEYNDDYNDIPGKNNKVQQWHC